MFVIRFEKSSLMDDMIYSIENDYSILMLDNQFQIAYPNSDSLKLRLYLKLLIYDKNLNFFIFDILDYLNLKFNSNNQEWSITYYEKVINNIHVIELYFYSNKYYTRLHELKKIVSNLHKTDITFDDSIYYRKNKKYSNFICDVMVNQSYQNNKTYKLFQGDVFNTELLNIEELTYFKLV